MGASSGTSSTEAAAATLRLTTLLKWPGTDHSPAALAKLGKWGLGKRRSLEQYAAFSGIDTIQATTQTGVCRVQYVPWASGAKHTVYSESAALSTRQVQRCWPGRRYAAPIAQRGRLR